MNKDRLIILGNGGASINAIRAVRANGYTGSIRVISDTEGPAFNPMLSPYYLDGKIPFNECFPFGMAFYERHGVTCHFGIIAEKLDPVKKEVYLETGECHTYDKCLIATGASPILPNIPGLRDSPRVLTLRTVEDTTRLHEAVSTVKSAVILGASLVGVKLAEILNRRGISVTLVDVADQILPNAVHPDGALLMAKHITGSGVDLRLGWTLESTKDEGRSINLHFQNKQCLRADLCVACTGVRPNLSFLSPSDVQIDQGILVDERMCTSAEGLYAAGDVSQGTNLLSGKKEIIGLWGNACYQGRTAGINMAGGDCCYYGAIPDHISTLFGINLVHLGDINRQGKDVVRLSNKSVTDDGMNLLFVFEEGALVGANLMNCYQHAGKLKSTMIRKLDWSEHLHHLVENPTSREIDRILYALNN